MKAVKFKSAGTDASAAYAEGQTTVLANLATLQAVLRTHANSRGGHKSWGMAGDLEHVNAQLVDVLRFLGIDAD